VVASKWAKVVAGASRIGQIIGNVNSLHRCNGSLLLGSRGFALHLSHIGSERVGIPADGIRPSKADNFDPACVNRKMLSIKRSTSRPPGLESTLGDGEAGKRDRARAPWLVHLSLALGVAGAKPVTSDALDSP
jgi:hypothetical protein